MSLGSRLRHLRASKGYGLREVAKVIGLSASTLSRAERDLYSPSLVDLERLTAHYDISLDSLLDGRELSLRADAATVRRAVLLADLEAMYMALDDSGERSDHIVSATLATLIYAVEEDRTDSLWEQLSPIWTRWGVERSEAIRKELDSARPDAAAELGQA